MQYLKVEVDEMRLSIICGVEISGACTSVAEVYTYF